MADTTYVFMYVCFVYTVYVYTVEGYCDSELCMYIINEVVLMMSVKCRLWS
jgi:hypothetical protein